MQFKADNPGIFLNKGHVDFSDQSCQVRGVHCGAFHPGFGPKCRQLVSPQAVVLQNKQGPLDKDHLGMPKLLAKNSKSPLIATKAPQ